MRARLAYFALLFLACSSDDGQAGPAPGAPTFAGIVSIAPASDRLLRVSWRPGSDAETGAASLRYRVYASIRAGGPLENTPVLTTEPNATSAYIEVGPPGSRHYVTVRAVDPEGHEDGNRVEKSGTPTSDTTAPTFAGVKDLEGLPEAAVKLTWDAASDDLTPPEAMRYAIFAGPDLVDWEHPLAVVEGVTEATIPAAIAPGETKRFGVRAIDAAENREENLVTKRYSLDATPSSPVFGGCAGVTTRGSKSVTVSWSAATDDRTPPEKITYEVWLATTAGAQVLGGEPQGRVTGATSVVVEGLTPNTTYFAICRAKDDAGNRETNSVEKSGKTSDDATAPTFAGIAAKVFDPVNRTVKLSWLAATDDRTASDKIVYDVFERRGSAAFDFTKPPRLTTAPNALSVDIVDLPSDTELAWVVRARDEAYNDDANLAIESGTTYVSFELDVDPIFAKNCAVVGCHVSALPAGGLSLSKAVAYANIYQRPANQKPPDNPTINRIEPGDPDQSYLLRKAQIVNPATPAFLGNPMPAPGTGNTLSDADKAKLQAWVQQGAPNN